MSDGILNGIFLIVHRNFLLSHFRGCWLLNFFFACVCSKYVDMKRLSRRFQADVFIKRLLQRGHEFWDETNLLAKEMLYNSARWFRLVFIFIHDSDKKRTFTRDINQPLLNKGPLCHHICTFIKYGKSSPFSSTSIFSWKSLFSKGGPLSAHLNFRQTRHFWSKNCGISFTSFEC